VVGVARSGTTLLRLQLDAHPELAIPPETHFAPVARRIAGAGGGPGELFHALVALPTWPDLGIRVDELADAFAALPERTLGAGLRACYRLYAARHGKPRWGDKTPANGLHMDFLAELLPEVRFIHIIRDCRDVAASLRGLPFAPGDGDVDTIAASWRNYISRTRTLARGVLHYREVRYERLVAEPEPVLRELCEFVELSFDRSMLWAHERAQQRLEELTSVRLADGSVRTADARRALLARTLQPPDPGRVGRWRTVLTAGETARVEAAAGVLLSELGY
jgi:Sulfotransferase family